MKRFDQKKAPYGDFDLRFGRQNVKEGPSSCELMLDNSCHIASRVYKPLWSFILEILPGLLFVIG